MKTIFSTILFSAVSLCCIAQDSFQSSSNSSNKWDALVSLNNHFLSDDYIIGANIGAMNANRNLSFFTEFNIRPYKKKVLDRQTATLYYQLAELRYYIGLGAEYSLYKKDGNIGLFLQPSFLYTWGEYSGTEIDVPNGLMVLPKLGVVWQFGQNGFLKAGVSYFNDGTERESETSVFLQLTGLLKQSYD